jgi:flagellar hook protein FlgE
LFNAAGSVTRVNFGEVSLSTAAPNPPMTPPIAGGGAMEITNNAGNLRLRCSYVASDGKTVNVDTNAIIENGRAVFKASGKEIFSFEIADGATLNPAVATNADPMELALTTKYEMTTSDKGGNVVETVRTDPRDPEAFTFTEATPGSGMGLTLGDATIVLSANPVTVPSGQVAFSGIIGRITMSEGEKLNVGCIALAKFANPAGLEQAGTTHFVKGQNSGMFSYAKPNSNGLGGIKSNYLEMSNVEVSKEFTDMITTQRGFQANTRIVTVSDEMLNELVNLKR